MLPLLEVGGENGAYTGRTAEWLFRRAEEIVKIVMPINASIG